MTQANLHEDQTEINPIEFEAQMAPIQAVLDTNEIGNMVDSAIADIKDRFANISDFQNFETRLDQTEENIKSLQELGMTIRLFLPISYGRDHLGNIFRKISHIISNSFNLNSRIRALGLPGTHIRTFENRYKIFYKIPFPRKRFPQIVDILYKFGYFDQSFSLEEKK